MSSYSRPVDYNMAQSLTPDAVLSKDFACAAVTSHAPPGNVMYYSDDYNSYPYPHDGSGDAGSMAYSTSALTDQPDQQVEKSSELLEAPPLAEQPVVYPWMTRHRSRHNG